MRRDPLDGSQGLLVKTSKLFRLGMEGDANSSLLKIIDALPEFLAGRQPEDAQTLVDVIADLLGAQERGDVLRIADLLEFELLPHVAKSSG